mgnify:CR=1 FL=1
MCKEVDEKCMMLVIEILAVQLHTHTYVLNIDDVVLRLYTLIYY